MFALNLWWQGFFTAVVIYLIYIVGQVVGIYKCKNGEKDE